MPNTLLVISLIACLCVLGVLLFGVGSFARGGDFNRKYANKIMRLRIIAQAIAVVLILVAVWAMRSGN
ncbi:Hypoxia induced protein conserved region [Albimonas donghaensis]|uniref:Hypoxia induced protein conserved region n=1 Tax=Albimonas donghaensis TaxID=356660 RepID=A0A1H2RDX3_9RHOB|nr:twin transmembrane helix small protein [Albimonas donghaensis]SDW17505.1 Hypoxia induced protein conserved region [Albimonas donghaensis]